MDKGHKIENEIYRLISLKLSGDATDKDLVRLQDLLTEHPAYQFLYDQLTEGATLNHNNDDLTAQAFAVHYTKKLQLDMCEEQGTTTETSKPKIATRRKYVWMSIAAAVFVGMVLGIVYQKTAFSDQKFSSKEMVTGKGSKSKVTLTDGTVVTLNADTKITYDKSFGNETREITLVGEAFFDVKHDADRPFIIHTGKADVKVLGTAFNVRNYPNDNVFETSLIRGKVEVTLHGLADKKIVLNPSEKLTLLSQDKEKVSAPQGRTTIGSPNLKDLSVTIAPVSLMDKKVVETSWVNNHLVFVNKPLVEIARELERQYNIEIRFKNDQS